MHDHLPLDIAYRIIELSGSWIIMDGRTCTPADICTEWCRMWRSSAEAVVESYMCLRPMSRARALARIARGRPYWNEATTKEILRRCVDGLDDDGLLVDAAFLESSKDGDMPTTLMRLLLDTFPERIDKVQKRTLEASLLNVSRNTNLSDAELAGAVRLLLGWPFQEQAPRANTTDALCALYSAATRTDPSAYNALLEVIKFLHENRPARGGEGSALNKGHLELVKFLHAKCHKGCTTKAMNGATSFGNLDVVLLLHEHRDEGCTEGAMDWAASNGLLDIVKWLHANRDEGCTEAAMDGAAYDGHLEVVKWLHANSNKGCTTHAMDGAASNGHLDVVKFLHEHRQEGCTTDAMDCAASNGHIEVVKFLHEHRNEGCTTAAMNGAARYGHLEVVNWLRGLAK